jgi:hypothetical protein
MRVILASLARTVEAETRAEKVRAHIMLPTGHGTRVVVYQYGMDNDPDADLELAMDGGCSGKAWATRGPAVADLVRAADTFESDWKMTRMQQAKVKPDLKSMFSVPIFDTTNRLAQSVNDLDIIGVLSVDSTTPLLDTGWLSDPARVEHSRLASGTEFLFDWADIVGEILR